MLRLSITKNDKTAEHGYTQLKHGNLSKHYVVLIDRFKRMVTALNGKKYENYIVWLTKSDGLSVCSVECDKDGARRYFIADKQVDRTSFVKWINHQRSVYNKVGAERG